MGVDITPSAEQIIRYIVASVLGAGFLYALLISYLAAKKSFRVLWILAALWTAGLGTLWSLLLREPGSDIAAIDWRSYVIAAVPTVIATLVARGSAPPTPQPKQRRLITMTFGAFVAAALVSFLLVQGL